MSVIIKDDEVVIDIPELKHKLVIKRSQIEKIEEDLPPDDVCKLITELREKGVIVAGTSIDGKVSYYNISPGKKCIIIKTRDGRRIYISKS
jgi:hypothetical protein